MEIFREIEAHFVALEEGQKNVTERMDTVEGGMQTLATAMAAMQAAMQTMQSTVQVMQTDMKVAADRSRDMQQELSAVRGCFAGIEAMLIANAAQMASVVRRLDALEKRAS